MCRSRFRPPAAEASGTGNMKFMLNGALTIGTFDGANVEMSEQAGMENMYIFGLREDEVMARYRHQTGEVQALYASNMPLKRVLDQLIDGTLEPQQPQIFREIYHSLLFGDYGMADPYMVTRDFDAYIEAQAQLARDYQDKALWTKKSGAQYRRVRLLLFRSDHRGIQRENLALNAYLTGNRRSIPENRTRFP